MKDLIIKLLDNLNCSGSYCQEYEYNVNSENFTSWKLYVKEYEMYSALLLYNDKLNKDISERLQSGEPFSLMRIDNTAGYVIGCRLKDQFPVGNFYNENSNIRTFYFNPTQSNEDILQQITSFINNITTSTVAGKIVNQRQALSKALKPKADN